MATTPPVANKFDENQVRDNLTQLGLTDREVHAVIETMNFHPEGKSYDKCTYEMSSKQDNSVNADIKIEQSQASLKSINLMDYLGLNNQHAYLFCETDDYIYNYLVSGNVEGKNCYARAT